MIAIPLNQRKEIKAAPRLVISHMLKKKKSMRLVHATVFKFIAPTY